MKQKIPWARPLVGREELKYIKDCFEKERFTQGKKVRKFEKNLAKITNSKYAIAVSNGTVALDLAYKALGIKSNDEVILPALSYISTASAISYQGAVPVFVDVNFNNNCIDASKIEDAITKKTKAISFIDYGGNPAHHEEIMKISRKHKIPIIHDGAQSLGAYLKNKPLGANGDISTMSFHMAKVVTTIEGGAVFTNNYKFYKNLLILRNIGESPNKKYHHSKLGTNARMTELQAGFGLAQLKKLKFILKQRKRVAQYYDYKFKKIENIKRFKVLENAKSANFFYAVMIPKRDFVAKKLKKIYGIDTRIAYPKPIYKQEMYKNNKLKYKKFGCKNTEEISKKILNLPIYPQMKKNEINYVANTLIKLVK